MQMTKQEWHELAQQLGKLIQKGDILIAASGSPLEVYEEMFCRKTHDGYHHYSFACWTGVLIMPISHYSIKEVWRNDVLLYRRGETMVQRSLF